MKFRKQRVIALSLTCLLGLGVVGCNQTYKPMSWSVDENAESKVLFERRLWAKTSASDIKTDDASNLWTYSKDRFSTFSSDGTLRFRSTDDSITSERFDTSLPFSVDVTMSMEGGLPIQMNFEKGELSFGIEALDSNKQVVSTAIIDEASQFPGEAEMKVITFHLNRERRNVSYIRLKCFQNYYKNYRTLDVGVGRVKVYTGNEIENILPPEIDDNYNSTVTKTNYNSSTDADARTASGITLQDVRSGSYDLTTNGNQKVLVIPVRFTDTQESVFPTGVDGFDGMRKIIEEAYFGQEDQTGWESLSSYYWKSSYNRLNISGKVTPWFTYPGTVQQFYDVGRGESSVYDLVDKASLWYKQNYDDYAEYDANNDGYFDCIQFVYAQNNCGQSTTGVCNRNRNPNAQDLFWAFTWKRSGVTQMKNWPTPFTFVWLSFDQLLNDFNETYSIKDGNVVTEYLADSHTVIHESGHALGLVDYYSTGYDGSTPAGKIDMMDNNVGDHNSYSKWQYNWIAPKEQIVYNPADETSKSYEVTLRPFESSGDFAVIPAYTYDELTDATNPGELNSSCSEFLTIEYYTPTGLNKLDSEEPYSAARGVSTMTESGLKMLHIDSRLAYLNYNNSSGEYTSGDYLPVNGDRELVTGAATGGSIRIDFPHHNDATQQNYDNPNFRLVLAVLADEAAEPNLLGSTGHTLSNADLWGSPTSGVTDFGITNHTDYTFNNNFKNVYSMEIISQSADEMTLRFSYIGQ